MSRRSNSVRPEIDGGEGIVENRTGPVNITDSSQAQVFYVHRNASLNISQNLFSGRDRSKCFDLHGWTDHYYGMEDHHEISPTFLPLQSFDQTHRKDGWNCPVSCLLGL